MDLSQEFVVPLSIGDAWAVLTDLERVAPCMPGAQLDEVEGEEYRGRVKVKVGPITVEYKGVATFLERDEAARRAVLRAQGRETKGQGNASATVTAVLAESGPGSTKVTVETALDISGRVAQFGRGALSDVSAKLLGQFVDNLEKDLASTPASAPKGPAPAGGDPVSTAATPAESGESAGEESGPATGSSASSVEGTPSAARQINSTPAEPVRVVGLVGSTLLKRLSPVVLLSAVAGIFWRIRRSRRSS